MEAHAFPAQSPAMGMGFHSFIAHCLAAATIALLSLAASAQSTVARWAVSSFGPSNSQAQVGCGGCASDQRTMAVDAAGNLVVTGNALNAAGVSHWKTVKFNGATGATIWEAVFDSGTGGPDQAWAVAVDGSGNAIVTGYAWNGLTSDIKAIKYAAATGATLWARAIPGLPGGNAFGIALAVDASGNAIIGGSVYNGTNDDMITVKLDSATGTPVWQKTFTGTANKNEYVFALALDSSGNVIVTGESQNNLGNYDWLTIKYDATSGTLLWQATYAGSGAADDVPYSIAVDSAGNAVVVGSTNNGANLDMKIIKYSGSNGAVLWQNTLAGAGNRDDIAYSVALDSADNALVAGFSFNGTNNQWNAVKYRAQDGLVLWQQTFPLPGSGSNVSPAIAVDSTGNAIVAGRVFNGTDSDMKAIKYAAADGSLLWQFTYNGSGAGFDRAAAVATATGTVFLAGESTEASRPLGWRVVNLDTAGLDPLGDADGDGIPNGVEPTVSRDPLVKDNDVFGNSRLFAMQQYRDFLWREGDGPGITGWTNAVTNGTWSRPQVIDAFVLSPEFSVFIAPVVRLYFATYLRIPDYAGLNANILLVRNGTKTMVQLADFFTTSPEFTALYGSLNNTQFVTLLYNNVLGRAPDTAGLNGWLALLAGGASRGQVLLGFSDSVEYKAAKARDVYVTMMYVSMLRQNPDPTGYAGWISYLQAGNPATGMISSFFGTALYHSRFLP
jgi:outer membrane protein assembly factor BamB